LLSILLRRSVIRLLGPSPALLRFTLAVCKAANDYRDASVHESTERAVPAGVHALRYGRMQLWFAPGSEVTLRQLVSTAQDKPGILVDVLSSEVIARNNQLLWFRSNGQPSERSQPPLQHPHSKFRKEREI
jgi:hypothetical protein